MNDQPENLEFKALRQRVESDTAAERGLYRQQHLPTNDHHLSETREQIESWNAELTAIRTDGDNAVGQVTAAINAAAESGNYGSLIATSEISKVDRATALGRLLAHVKAGVTLARKAGAELRAAVQLAEESRDAVIATVKDDLSRIGQGVETTIAGRAGHNPKAAEQQFRFLAEQNSRSQVAIAAVNTIRGAVDQYNDIAAGYTRAVLEIEKVVGKLVSRLVA
jgi:hypothetical protein